MFDLRDPSYVPPHLRKPVEVLEVPKRIVGLGNEPAHPRVLVPSVLPQPNLYLSWEAYVAVLVTLQDIGVVDDVRMEDGGSLWKLKPFLEGLDERAVADFVRMALCQYFVASAPPGPVAEAKKTGRPVKYQFDTLSPGEGFALPPGSRRPGFQTMQSYCSKMSKRYGCKFKVRKDDSGSYWVWREA